MARSSSPSFFELDFFSMETKEFNALPPAAKPSLFQRRRSFRDIQGVISKMNPEIVKSVIENGALASNKSSVSVPSTPKETQTHSPLLLAYDRELSLRCGRESNAEKTGPMTIFYNGRVSVFDVSPRKAQDILKFAEEISPKKSAEYPECNLYREKNLLESLNGDLPISRRNSLQRFLEKRKERLTMLSPYYFPTDRCDSSKSPFSKKN